MVEIFEELKKEHRKAKEIIEKIEKTGDKDSLLTKELSKLLVIHMNGEERFFYPELEEFNELKGMIFEAYEEHDLTERVLRRIRWSFNEIGFMARLKVLKELLLTHISHEENILFIEAEKLVAPEHFKVMEENYLDYKERKMDW